MKVHPLYKQLCKVMKMEFPRRIYFAITNRCNLECLHCYRISGRPHKDELSLKEILGFLKYCVENSKAGLLTITLTGGEPFTRYDIWDIVEYCFSSNINIDIATNGLLIDRDSVLKLKYYQNLNIQLSVDGASKTSIDSLRGNGAYKRLMNTLKLIKDEKIYDYIDMNFVSILTKINYREIYDIINLAKDHMISKVVFSECFPVGRAKNNEKQVVLSPDELQQVVETISLIKKVDSSIVVVSQFYFDFFYDQEFARPNVCTAECGDVVCIGPSGDVTLCPAFSEDNESFIGNIRENKLMDIINSDKANQFKKLASQEPIDCSNWNMCKGGCHILAYKRLSSSQECDPRCPKKCQ